MSKKLVRAALSAWLLGGVAAVAITAATVPAQAADTAPAKPKTTKGVGLALQAALAAALAKDMTTAQAKLGEARAVTDVTEFDRVEIDQVTAYIAINSTPSDHPGALAAYKSAIANPSFPLLEQSEQTGTLKNAMILCNEIKDFACAVQIGEKVMATGHIDDMTAGTLAVAYYYNKDYAKARTLAQKSVDVAIAAGNKPDHGSLQIIMNSYADEKDQLNARKILELIALYYGTDPQSGPETWDKMLAFAWTPGLKDMQILQVYRLRYLSGAESEAGDYSAGAELAMKNGYPGEARNVLQLGAQRGKGSGGAALTEARNKAAADEKTIASSDAAGAKSPNGQGDTLTAEQYYGYGRYAEAETAARRAIGKGGAKDPEEAKMVLGMALTAEGKYADAVQAFAQVGGNDGQRKIAHVWSVYAQGHAQTVAASAPAAPAKTQ